MMEPLQNLSILIVTIFTMTTAFPAWGSIVTQETLAPRMETPGTVVAMSRDLIAYDGGGKIKDGIERLRTELGAFKRQIGGLLWNDDDSTIATRRLQEIPREIVALEIGQSVFGTFDKGLIPRVAARARRVENKVVVAYDLAYFAFSPDAYARLWRYIRENRDQKIGQKESGVIFALLPYAIGEKESPLSGINPRNLDEVFKTLNAFAKEHTGNDVNLSPEDFGVIVPSELLGDASEVNRYIIDQTGGVSISKIFARKKVAEALRVALTHLIGRIFDLPLEEGKTGLDLEGLDAILVTEGGTFTTMPVISLSRDAREAVQKIRGILTKL